MSDSVEIAERLRVSADDFLCRRVEPLLERFGRVNYVGSYALDLMAWPDIDLSLVLHEGVSEEEALAGLAADFVIHPNIDEVKYRADLNKKYPFLPKGRYLKATYTDEEAAPWKLDIWIVDAARAEADVLKRDQIQASLNPESRRLILDWKKRHMTPEGRTPKFSGYHLYCAILFEGLRSDEEITAFVDERIRQ